MARLIITPTGSSDQAAILEHLGLVAGERSSLKYDSAFFQVFQRLTEHPESGASRPRLGRDIRIAAVKPYLVIYHYDRGDDAVRVLRVVDGRRNITRGLVNSARP